MNQPGVVIVHVNSLNKKDPPTTLLLAVNLPLLLLYRKDNLLNISLPERYICAKGQHTQVSAAAVLIKDKPIPNVFQYRINCLNATPCLSTEQQVQQQLRWHEQTWYTFDTMKRFCLYSQCSHLNLQTLFHLRWMLRGDAFRVNLQTLFHLRWMLRGDAFRTLHTHSRAIWAFFSKCGARSCTSLSNVSSGIR